LQVLLRIIDIIYSEVQNVAFPNCYFSVMKQNIARNATCIKTKDDVLTSPPATSVTLETVRSRFIPY